MFHIVENFPDGFAEAIDWLDDRAEADHYVRILNAQCAGLSVRYTVEAA
jgi:AraC-like DNA-binding protein